MARAAGPRLRVQRLRGFRLAADAGIRHLVERSDSSAEQRAAARSSAEQRGGGARAEESEEGSGSSRDSGVLISARLVDVDDAPVSKDLRSAETQTPRGGQRAPPFSKLLPRPPPPCLVRGHGCPSTVRGRLPLQGDLSTKRDESQIADGVHAQPRSIQAAHHEAPVLLPGVGAQVPAAALRWLWQRWRRSLLCCLCSLFCSWVRWAAPEAWSSR